MERERLRKKSEGVGSYFAGPKSDLDFIPTGCKTLDLAMGGGWCEGRVGNVVGDKSTGKTLLCIEASANFVFKRPKSKVRYRECESAFDEKYAGTLGMPLDNVDFGQAQIDTVEDLFEDLEKIIKGAKGPELVVVDSLDSLSDREEMKRDISEGSYGAEKAKKMSQLFRRVVRPLEEKRITLLIVSQVRDKIGVSFGRKTTRSGGKALDFYATHVLYLAHLGRLTQTVRGTKRPVGIKVKALVDKNKVGLPYREAEFKIRFGFGIDDAEACCEFLKGIKSLPKAGIKNVDDFLDDVADMDGKEYRETMARLHDVVAAEWYAIDQTLMPKRQKYGD